MSKYRNKSISANGKYYKEHQTSFLSLPRIEEANGDYFQWVDSLGSCKRAGDGESWGSLREESNKSMCKGPEALGSIWAHARSSKACVAGAY